MTLDEHIEFFTELKQYMEFFAALEDSQLVANIEYKLLNANIQFNFYYNSYQKSVHYAIDLEFFTYSECRLFPVETHNNRLFALRLVINQALQMLIRHKSLPQF